ncbi:hypothetical protein ACH5RR_019787 [Cinchona calisaya]|uniref:CCT domain-containing protein n=1 Tax=Cinchona calisaya TaxID=153742 RepID=A0ABD2ZQU1_9GENT
MYAETGLIYPYFHSFPQEVQQLQDFSFSQKTNALAGNLIQASLISEYDLGGEGDLFKAPEPIIEEPVIGLDPMAAAISMISCGGDVIGPQDLKVSDIESSIDNGQLLSEVFYECKNDILAKEATESTFSEVLDVKVLQENLITVGDLLSQGSFQKSVSSGCLSSMEWIHGAPIRPNFLDFPGMDLGAVYGMRRAFSEGDIKTLGNGNINLIHSPVGQGQPQINTSCMSEDRKEKLSRYRNKKTKRNFGRKIKYACRKALADTQPRIRGRFAKTQESDASKKQ